MTAALAPIALFVFKRPQHTRRALQALAANPEFTLTPLHIFCDGARSLAEQKAVEDTRRLVRAWQHPDKHLHEAPANFGLANSVIAGVSMLCKQHGRVIVVEDDLVVASVFLNFMNRALHVYADEQMVMQVSAHMFGTPDTRENDVAFLPFITSWGWATWSRAWEAFDAEMHGYQRLRKDLRLRLRFDLEGAYPYFNMLRRQRAGRVDSWAIRWYLSVFLRGGLALYPCRSLVSNEGLDGSGTHGAKEGSSQPCALTNLPPSIPLLPIVVDEPMMRHMQRHFRQSRSRPARIFDWFARRVVW